MANTYAVIGTGAVGGFYGAVLANAGFDVDFLVRSDFDTVRRDGLRVLSPDGDIALPHARVHNHAADMPRVDVVIVAVKATANAEVPALLEHVAKPDSTIVLMQNGLGGEETISTGSHARRIVGGLSFVCAKKIAAGTIRHEADRLVDLAIWTRDGAPAPPDAALLQLAAELGQAGIPTRLFDNLALARWRKLVWNIPFGGLCILFDADTRRIVEDPDTLAMARAVMNDVAAAAAACGQTVGDDFLHRMIDDTIALPAFVPSTKFDFDAGSPLELEAIFGNPLRAARAAGYTAQLVDNLYRQLLVMDRKRTI